MFPTCNRKQEEKNDVHSGWLMYRSQPVYSPIALMHTRCIIQQNETKNEKMGNFFSNPEFRATAGIDICNNRLRFKKKNFSNSVQLFSKVMLHHAKGIWVPTADLLLHTSRSNDAEERNPTELHVLLLTPAFRRGYQRLVMTRQSFEEEKKKEKVGTIAHSWRWTQRTNWWICCCCCVQKGQRKHTTRRLLMYQDEFDDHGRKAQSLAECLSVPFQWEHG